MRVRLAISAACVAMVSMLAADSTSAALPGTNGRIAFVSTRDGNSEIYTMNADGTAVTRLTSDPRQEHDPAWSPDGRRIAFTRAGNFGFELWIMNADGSGQHQIAPPQSFSDPSWSPDGTRLAVDQIGAGSDIAVMNDDGTNRTNFILQDDESDPAWSPLGTHIVYVRQECDPDPETCLGHTMIEVMAPNGSGRTLVWGGGFEALTDPDWFPNGQRIAFNLCDENDVCAILFVNADGTGLAGGPADGFEPAVSSDGARLAYTKGADIYIDGVNITNNPAADFAPAWQPIPIGYPRPRGASPSLISLVPAYAACTAANRTHGAPLAFGSCAPPSQTSPELTVGTPDANGRGANAAGSVTLITANGNPATAADEADVRVDTSLTDVRRRSDLSDYTGEIGLRLPLRITDRNNTGAGPATVSDTSLQVTVPCVGTGATTVGSTCAASTTVEAVVPGAVKEGVRSIWELSQLRVYDGGADGDADTADNSLFAVQGVFVP
jgi:WD40 repeat protein